MLRLPDPSVSFPLRCGTIWEEHVPNKRENNNARYNGASWRLGGSMNWSDIPTWLLLIGGIALWLVFGAVFGSSGKIVRDAVREACTAVADALRIGATTMLSWAKWCFTNIEKFMNVLIDFVPELVGLRPHSTQDVFSTSEVDTAVAPATNASDVSPTMVALATIGLLAFVAMNGYLLFEITPDLFAFSPEMLEHGAGRFISWLVPLAILLGEVIGGLLLKSEQRRKRANNTEASTMVPWVIFLFCYGVELAAGIRRAVSFLESASPFADEATHITWDSVTTSALWLVLAAGIPWTIFLISRYVEPALNQSDAARQLLRFFAQALRVAAAVVGIAAAGIIAGLTLGIGGVVTGGIGVVVHVLGGAVRYLVYGILFVLVVALIDASGMTMTWLRSWRGTTPPSAPSAAALVLVIASALLSAGCQKTTASTARTDRKFPTVSVSDLKSAPQSDVFRKVATVNLPKYIGERHKVVRVLEPMLHVCLADVTASVDLELRRALLRKCAESVSDLSNGQGPETTGMVVPIVDAALTSKLPIERLDGAMVPTRCVTNPPIPDFPSRSTVADAKVKSIRDAFVGAERDCTEAVGREYAMATRTRDEQRSEFESRVLRELGGRVYQRTDIIGALRYVAELVRTERKQFGRGLAVRVSIISDLEDDANGCVLRNATVSCPDAPMRDVRTLLTDANTRYQLHQVMQGTTASRKGAAYVAAKGETEARQEAWRAFWVSIAPDHVEPFTFTAPPVVRRTTPVEPSAPPEVDDPPAASAPSTPSAPPVVTAPPAPAPTANEPRCARSDFLQQKHGAMDRQALSSADWIAYGNALAACGPRTKPWESVGLSSREAFADQYVIPFLNGDVAQGAMFLNSEPDAHARIMRSWGLDDG